MIERPRSARPARHRSLLWRAVVVLALVCHGLLPLAANAVPVDRMARLSICTGDGLVKQQGPCPVCPKAPVCSCHLTAAQGAAVPPALVGSVILPGEPSLKPPRREARIVVLRPGSAQPRAPPPQA